MGYLANIVEYSVAPHGIPVVTAHLRYPRLAHADLLTHRALSRNGKSSRAKPGVKLIQDVYDDPVEPLFWGANRSGMQSSSKEIKHKWLAKLAWRWAKYNCLASAWVLNKLNLHKQWANRIIEPWLFMDTLVTTTDLDNLFHLRCHKDAQPELQKAIVMLAREVRKATPKQLKVGEWHIPYILPKERVVYPIDTLLKFSAARCARISYNNFDGTRANAKKDLDLYNKLVISEPVHSSPTEHQARAEAHPNHRSGNLRGYTQYRKLIPNEVCTAFDYSRLDEFPECGYIV